jgi:hypothetical protein
MKQKFLENDMKDWFNTRYSAQELREIVVDHPAWIYREVPENMGRAALAAELERLDQELEEAV